MNKKKRKPRKLERHVIAVELPLRMRAATLGGIAARNEKLNALQAAAIRADLKRVKQMLDETPLTQKSQVQGVATQLQKDLAKTIAAGR